MLSFDIDILAIDIIIAITAMMIKILIAYPTRLLRPLLISVSYPTWKGRIKFEKSFPPRRAGEFNLREVPRSAIATQPTN